VRFNGPIRKRFLGDLDACTRCLPLARDALGSLMYNDALLGLSQGSRKIPLEGNNYIKVSYNGEHERIVEIFVEEEIVVERAVPVCKTSGVYMGIAHPTPYKMKPEAGYAQWFDNYWPRISVDGDGWWYVLLSPDCSYLVDLSDDADGSDIRTLYTIDYKPDLEGFHAVGDTIPVVRIGTGYHIPPSGEHRLRFLRYLWTDAGFSEIFNHIPAYYEETTALSFAEENHCDLYEMVTVQSLDYYAYTCTVQNDNSQFFTPMPTYMNVGPWVYKVGDELVMQRFQTYAMEFCKMLNRYRIDPAAASWDGDPKEPLK